MFVAGFLFFDDGDPANPLIASEGSDGIPFFQDVLIGCEGLLYIVGDVVECCWEGGLFGHGVVEAVIESTVSTMKIFFLD